MAYEETFHRAESLDEAIAFIDWHRNALTVNIPEENMSDAKERKIREFQKLRNMELFRNGSRRRR